MYIAKHSAIKDLQFLWLLSKLTCLRALAYFLVGELVRARVTWVKVGGRRVWRLTLGTDPVKGWVCYMCRIVFLREKEVTKLTG